MNSGRSHFYYGDFAFFRWTGGKFPCPAKKGEGKSAGFGKNGPAFHIAIEKGRFSPGETGKGQVDYAG